MRDSIAIEALDFGYLIVSIDEDVEWSSAAAEEAGVVEEVLTWLKCYSPTDIAWVLKVLTPTEEVEEPEVLSMKERGENESEGHL